MKIFIAILFIFCVVVPLIGPYIYHKPWFYVDAQGNWNWQ